MFVGFHLLEIPTIKFKRSTQKKTQARSQNGLNKNKTKTNEKENNIFKLLAINHVKLLRIKRPTKRNFNNNFKVKLWDVSSSYICLNHIHTHIHDFVCFNVSVSMVFIVIGLTNLDRLLYNSWMDRHDILLGNCTLAHGFWRYNQRSHHKFQRMG